MEKAKSCSSKSKEMQGNSLIQKILANRHNQKGKADSAQQNL